MLHKWDIFDKYIDVYISEEEKKKKDDLLLNMGGNKKQEKRKVDENANSESLSKPSLLKVLKLVER